MEISEETIKCPYCKETIQKEAIKCKHCGTMLLSIVSNDDNSEKKNSLWLSILSLVCGVIILFAVLGESEQDKDFMAGVFSFSLVSLLSGTITIVRKLNGQGMAIAGIIVSILALLIAVGN